MEKVLNFIIEKPSYAIIILLVIIIAIREIGIKNILGVIRGTQKEKYPKLEGAHVEIMQELHKQNQILSEQNKKFATNHSMHEIPDIKADVGDIKKTLDKVVDIQRTQGVDIATLLERTKKI